MHWFFSVLTQAKQHRQRHPVWKPGGDPHLPSGTVCDIGGVYQVRHMHHKCHVKTPSLWARAVLGQNGSILLADVEGRRDIFNSVYGLVHMLTSQMFCRETQLNIFIPSCFLPQSSASLDIFLMLRKKNHSTDYYFTLWYFSSV